MVPPKKQLQPAPTTTNSKPAASKPQGFQKVAPQPTTKTSPKKSAPPVPPKKADKQPPKGKGKKKEESSDDEDESASEESFASEEQEIEVKKAVKQKTAVSGGVQKKAIQKKKSVAPATKNTKAKGASPKKAPAKVVEINTLSKKKASSKKRKEEEDEDEQNEDEEFNVPGQTKHTPDETDPLRIFYESLYKQRPDSKMAEQYCLDHGLLGVEKAQEVLDRINREKNQKGGVIRKK